MSHVSRIGRFFGIPEIDLMKIDCTKLLILRMAKKEMVPVLRKLSDGDLIDLANLVEEELVRRKSAGIIEEE